MINNRIIDKLTSRHLKIIRKKIVEIVKTTTNSIVKKNKSKLCYKYNQTNYLIKNCFNVFDKFAKKINAIRRRFVKFLMKKR